MSVLRGSETPPAPWRAEQRQDVLDLASRREAWVARWLAVAGVGIVLAVVTAVAGGPVPSDLPPRSVAPVLVALVVAAGFFAYDLFEWRAVANAFREQPSPPVRTANVGTGVGGLVTLIVSLVCGVLSGVSPAGAIVHGNLTWDQVTMTLAVVASVACGVAAIRLWVNLLPVRQAGVARR